MDKHDFRTIQKKLNLTDQGVSEALDVQLFTVQQWGTGIWGVPRIAAKFLRVLLQIKRTEAERSRKRCDEGYTKVTRAIR